LTQVEVRSIPQIRILWLAMDCDWVPEIAVAVSDIARHTHIGVTPPVFLDIGSISV